MALPTITITPQGSLLGDGRVYLVDTQTGNGFVWNSVADAQAEGNQVLANFRDTMLKMFAAIYSKQGLSNVNGHTITIDPNTATVTVT